MNTLFQHISRKKWFSRVLLPVVAGLIVLLIGTSLWVGLARRNQPESSLATPTGSSQSSPQVLTSVSPLLFGGNLEISSQQEQALPTPVQLTLLQQVPLHILRLPAYKDPSHTRVTTMGKMIQQMGVTPLIVLHGSMDPDAFTRNSHLVQAMNTLFGKSPIYYEFGDEDDALGADAQRYVSAWNSNIARLKYLAPQARFLGPGTFRYSKDFLATFLQQANPKPDAITWHEYSCLSSSGQEQCFTQLAEWKEHIASAHQITQASLGKVLPIMITEWNYAANATSGDGKSNDEKFLTSWTTRAIQTLAHSQVFAAMHSACFTGAAPLFKNNTLAPQGKALQQQYNLLIPQTQQPQSTPTMASATATVQPIATTQPTPTVAAATPTVQPTSSSSTMKFSFEDGGLGGFGKSNTMTNLENSTDVAWDGQHSLKITISNSTEKDYPTLWFDGAPLESNPVIGQTFYAYVYVPPDSFPPVAAAYILDSNHKQCDACHSPGWQQWVTLIPGKWSKVTYKVAPGVALPSTGFGISLTIRSQKAVNTIVYVDAVGWG